MSIDGGIYRTAVAPLLQRFASNDAEVTHDAFVQAMEFLAPRPRLTQTLLPKRNVGTSHMRQHLMDGLVFEHPFGISAGMDKTGKIFPALFTLFGASHMEVGGVTPLAQPGNERPRIARATKYNIINSMGFPGPGVEAVLDNIAALPSVRYPLGIQIAKQKTTNDSDAPSEYASLIRACSRLRKSSSLPDYYVVNVSSPNTPGLRNLQEKSKLSEIFGAVTEALDEQKSLATHPRKRLLVKLAPDLEHQTVADTIELIEEFDTGGLILTNTTMTRPIDTPYNDRPGGFSGWDLYPLSSSLVKFAAALLKQDRVLIATGGIDTPERAWEMLQYADLVGCYSGLITRGPDLFSNMSRYVAERMTIDGVSNLVELRSPNRPD